MKTKKRIFTLLVGLIAFTSCNDWLDVSSNSDVKAEDLFKTQTGFQDALLGIYTKMIERPSYGGMATIAMMDIYAGYYSSVGHYFSALAEYDLAGDLARNYNKELWEAHYVGISNCNYLLHYLDEADPAIFETGIAEMVRAEAMALRAFLHFDAARYWGPVPVAANMNKLSVPYVDHVTKVAQPQLTLLDLIGRMKADLLVARDLIAPFDPLGPAYDEYDEGLYYEQQNIKGDQYNDDGFTMYRQSRFNYYGITALLARISLWEGNKPDALKYSREVIDSGMFSLIEESDLNNSIVYNMTQKEYITSLYKWNIETTVAEYFYRYNTPTAINTRLVISNDKRDDIFGSPGSTIDWRNQSLFGFPTDDNYEMLLKYFNIKRIPLLKLSEMYLIAAESGGGVSYLNDLRARRGYMNYPLTEAELKDGLKDEYVKEFISEGQLLFYYKRTNSQSLLGNPSVDIAKLYNPDFPDDELEYGNIKQ